MTHHATLAAPRCRPPLTRQLIETGEARLFHHAPRRVAFADVALGVAAIVLAVAAPVTVILSILFTH